MFNHNADQAYRNPEGNFRVLRRVYELLEKAAKVQDPDSRPRGTPGQADAIIRDFISRRTKSGIDDLLDRRPLGGQFDSYREVINQAEGWNEKEIDNTIPDPPAPSPARPYPGSTNFWHGVFPR